MQCKKKIKKNKKRKNTKALVLECIDFFLILLLLFTITITVFADKWTNFGGFSFEHGRCFLPSIMGYHHFSLTSLSDPRFRLLHYSQAWRRYLVTLSFSFFIFEIQEWSTSFRPFFIKSQNATPSQNITTYLSSHKFTREETRSQAHHC